MTPIIRKTAIVMAVSMALFSCQKIEQDQEKDELILGDTKQLQVPNEPQKSEDEYHITHAELLKKVRDHERINQHTNKERIAEFRSMESARQAAPITVTGSRMAYSDMARPVYTETNRENYKHFDDSGVFSVTETPVSTFSIDVDTASYSNVRRMLNNGSLPPEDAVRLEEFINYFDYSFSSPASTSAPFSVTTEAMAAPWNKNAHILQIGIKGYEPDEEPLPPSNLVFLVDVSGSMNSPDKLGLVKKALKLLSKQSSARDKISLVVYAGASGVVLEPTSADQTLKIEQALDRLSAGGSTNGGAGIELAYQMAEQAFIKDGINRVILATDGDFNVGTVNHDQLVDLIERKRESGVYFSALGFGSGNYNEHLMEELSNKGNGNYGYIDSLQEAKKLLVDQRAGTLMTIAKDVKIQVEFNPNVISEYRLLGYENRALNREDFNNDKVDAGEIGAGHTITALYEVVLKDSEGQRLEPLRYSQPLSKESSYLSNEAAMVKLRYKLPDQDHSKLIEQAVHKADFYNRKAHSDNIRFATGAAAFAQLLRGGRYLGQWDWQDAIDYANHAKGHDNNGYRAEMVQLMKMAQMLSSSNNESHQRQVGMVQK